MAETDDPKLHLVDLDQDFTGNMLIIETERAESSLFNIILAKSQGTVIFQVTGEGKVTMKDATVSGAVTADSFVSATGATVSAVGLQIDAGGMTMDAGPLLVKDGGAEIDSAAAGTPVLTLTGTSASFTDSVLRVATNTAAGSGFNLIEAQAGGATQFVVDGTGKVTTNGGVTVTAGGMTVTGGITVTDTGFTVTDGGISVTESAAGGLPLHVTASHATFASNVITGKTTRAANAAFNMLLLEAAGTDLFSVSGTGKTTVHQVRSRGRVWLRLAALCVVWRACGHRSCALGGSGWLGRGRRRCDRGRGRPVRQRRPHGHQWRRSDHCGRRDRRGRRVGGAGRRGLVRAVVEHGANTVPHSVSQHIPEHGAARGCAESRQLILVQPLGGKGGQQRAHAATGTRPFVHACPGRELCGHGTLSALSNALPPCLA